MTTPADLDDIITPRLILNLMNSEVIAACLLDDIQSAEQLLGVQISEEMLDYTDSFIHGNRQLENDPDYLPWSARAIILPDEQVMIGMIRFHTRPDPEYLHAFVRDAVEIGYFIFSKYRRLNYATEAVKAVMAWAQQQFGVRKFVASVSPDNNASLKLITNLGFTKIGEAMDEVDGMEHVFLYDSP